MNQGSKTLGTIFLLIGGFLLLNNFFDFNFFSMSKLWPIFVLGPGLVFEVSYFTSKKAPGLLVPGGILSTYGLFFFFMTFTSWLFLGELWPIFILGPAVGLFQLYLAIGRPKGLLIPVGILTAVGGVFLSIEILGGFLSFINYSILAPVIFIVVGVIIIFGRSGNKENF